MAEPKFVEEDFRGEMREVHQGVRAAIYNSSGEILMLYRENEEWDTGWEIVKGSVEVGETDRESVKREIEEETGVEYEIIDKREQPFDALIPKEVGEDVPVHSWLYIAEYRGGDIELGEPEHTDCEWMQPSKAQKKIWWEDGDEVIDYAEKVIRDQMR